MDQQTAVTIINRACKNYLQQASYLVRYAPNNSSDDEDYDQTYCLGQACGNRNCHLDYTECTVEVSRHH